MMFKGLRTKIAGYLTAAPMVLGVLGYQISPDTIAHILSNWGVPTVAIQALLALAVHFYRNEADLDAVEEVPEVVHQEPQNLPTRQEFEKQYFTLEEIEELTHDIT